MQHCNTLLEAALHEQTADANRLPILQHMNEVSIYGRLFLYDVIIFQKNFPPPEFIASKHRSADA
jgi:hypothetical protein